MISYVPSLNKIHEPIFIAHYFHIFLLPSQENFLFKKKKKTPNWSFYFILEYSQLTMLC